MLFSSSASDTHREIQALILGQIRKHRDMAEQGVDRMDPLRAGLLERTQFPGALPRDACRGRGRRRRCPECALAR